MQNFSKIILGIDPGTLFMGYSIIGVERREPVLIEMGVLKLSSRKDAYERLQLIHRKIDELICNFKPNDFAIEAPFFGKNVQSMLKLGRAQGVAIATAMHAGIPVTEYSPKKVKMSITGNGNSGKDQVWKMLQRILQIETEPVQYDASDALAVAVCHHFQAAIPDVDNRKVNSWQGFISKNPGRVIR